MKSEITKLLSSEQARRAACWNPIERERVIMETITWADAQKTVRRNTPHACRAEEKRKLIL